MCVCVRAYSNDRLIFSHNNNNCIIEIKRLLSSNFDLKYMGISNTKIVLIFLTE